jgi:hypothetical protein
MLGRKRFSALVLLLAVVGITSLTVNEFTHHLG